MCEYGDYGNVMGRRDVCDEWLFGGVRERQSMGRGRASMPRARARVARSAAHPVGSVTRSTKGSFDSTARRKEKKEIVRGAVRDRVERRASVSVSVTVSCVDDDGE